MAEAARQYAKKGKQTAGPGGVAKQADPAVPELRLLNHGYGIAADKRL